MTGEENGRVADGASSPFSQRALAAMPACAGRDRTVWTPPEHIIEHSRSWQRTSAMVVTRAGGEGFWRSDQHLFSFFLSDLGRGTIKIEGGRTHQLETTPHHVSFLPAGVGAHTVLSVSECKFVSIIQSPATYRDLASEFSSPVCLDDFEPLPTFDDPQIVWLIRSIAEEIDSDGLDHLLVQALNTALAVQLARHFRGPSTRLLPAGQLSRERLRRVLDYIEAHLACALSLDDLAAVACLSPYHFARCFKRSMGMGPHRYVTEQRIERARRFVLHSDMTLTDIAAAVGFESQSSFTSCFGREVGVSPGRLRRERA